MHALSRRTVEFIRQHELLRPGDRAVVGLSGGPDSVALLLVLAELVACGELPLEIRPAHLNHGLRGEESAADERFCAELSERLGLPLAVERAAELAGDRGSVEERARKARYGFLGRTAVDAGADAVAVGHHADDAAETVLLRLLRGAALRGLGAMPPERPLGPEYSGVRLVRPLLEATRAGILAFLNDRGQHYRTDRSNRDTRYARNRVRHVLLPALRRDFPTFSAASLGALNQSAREASEFIECALEKAWPRVMRSADAGLVVLDAGALARLAPALRTEAIRRALETADAAASRSLGADQLRAAALLGEAPVGSQVGLPGGLTARRDHGAVVVGRPREGGPEAERVLSLPGEVVAPEAGLVIRSEVLTAGGIGPADARDRSSAMEVFVGGTDLGEQLCVRSRRPGDRFRPLGAPGRMTLKQFFIDQHVPRHERDRVPLVTAADGRIVWVVGLRIAHPFRLTGREGRVLRLRALPRSGSTGV